MHETASTDRISATGGVAAPAHDVRLIVCDPVRHVDIDGSGTMQAAVDAGPLVAVGQTFDTEMDRAGTHLFGLFNLWVDKGYRQT